MSVNPDKTPLYESTYSCLKGLSLKHKDEVVDVEESDEDINEKLTSTLVHDSARVSIRVSFASCCSQKPI